MHNRQNKLSLLSQLDESERGNIITAGELEEIGAAYESKEKYEETMRDLAERLSKPRMGRGNTYVPVGSGKTSQKLKRARQWYPRKYSKDKKNQYHRQGYRFSR